LIKKIYNESILCDNFSDSNLFNILHYQESIVSKENRKDAAFYINNWGKIKSLDNFYDYERIDLLSKFSNPEVRYHRLSDQTLDDLDFQDVFSFVDRTTSRVGQQYLYNKILNPIDDVKRLNILDKQVKYFINNPELRFQVQKKLSLLSKPEAYSIAKLIHAPSYYKDSYYYLFVLDTVLLIVSLLLIPFYSGASIITLALITINMGLYFWGKSNLLSYMVSLPQLSLLIKSVKDIEKLNIDQSLFDTRFLKESLDKGKIIRNRIRVINFDLFSNDADPVQIAKYITDLIKAFFLIEIHMLRKIQNDIFLWHKDLLNLFNFIGNIDTVISIASLRSGEEQTCIPVLIEEGKILQAVNIYHPLLKNCIVNSIELNGKSAIITGSNMSGKSSFLRTVAINNILAQTIFTCFGTSYKATSMALFTSLRIRDSILEGKSYYKAEVDLISQFVENSEIKDNCLFILDEVLKGTNTLERIASASSILKYLDLKNHIVLVATHDVELINLLGSKFEPYYFEEQIIEGNLLFDHKIKSGVLKNTNAIRILEISNLPIRVIHEANKTLQSLIDKG